MRFLLGFLALGLLGAVCLARPSEFERHTPLDDSEKTLIRVLRSDLEDEEPVEKKKVEKKRSDGLNRKRRAEQEDEFFQALLSRSGQTKTEQKRSFDENGADNKGFIIRDDWKGDSKISDADRTELENLFSAINAPQDESKEKNEETRSVPENSKMKKFIEWIVAQPPKEFHKALDHIVDVEDGLTKMLYNGYAHPKPKPASKAKKLSDSVSSGKDNKTQDDIPKFNDEASKKKFCQTKCYDINVAGINCRIVCHPPHVDTTGGVQMMQQMPYQPYSGQLQTCSPPTCLSTPQSPCNPQGCTPQYTTSNAAYGSTYGTGTAYPQTSYATGYMPPQNSYPGQYGQTAGPMTPMYPQHPHVSHHAKGKKGGKQHDSHKKSNHGKKLNDAYEQPEVPYEYEYEGSGENEEMGEEEHPHWVHHLAEAAPPGVNVKKLIEKLEEEGFDVGEGIGGGGGHAKGTKYPGVEQENDKAYGPVTLNTLGATVHVSPFSFSSPGGPVMTPAHIGVYQPQPQMAQAPLLPQPPQYAPADPYGVAPLPPKQDMPSDCNDYAEKRCQVFLDWPTDKSNEIKASLRFKQNWHPDYRKRHSTKYRLFKTELESALKDAYSSDTAFVKAKVTGFSEEDMKTTASFTLKFSQHKSGALRALANAVEHGYLKSMPIERGTLLRDGVRHIHRAVVPSQKELDKLPSPTAEKHAKKSKTHKKHKLMDTSSRAYQGCFNDKRPNRDLPMRFNKFEMTPEWCVGRCKLAGYKFAGLQYAYLCFCGNKFGKYGKADEVKCSSKCYGDKNRSCGAFWHNSIYSVDGQKHDVSEFANMSDDDEDDDGSADEDAVNKLSGPGHAEVANHLMKAAEAALKAAKRLLPPRGKKTKRMIESELATEKAKAVAALGAAQELMDSEQKEKKMKKRSTEDKEGRHMLVAFLGDMHAYGREYRDVESQEDGPDKRKFEYRRMVIDESGDGEFVEKETKKRRKRELVSWDTDEFDGPKKMAARSSDESQASTRREQIQKNAEDEAEKEEKSESSESPAEDKAGKTEEKAGEAEENQDKPEETQDKPEETHDKPEENDDKPKAKEDNAVEKEDKPEKKVKKAEKAEKKEHKAAKKADKPKKKTDATKKADEQEKVKVVKKEDKSDEEGPATDETETGNAREARSVATSEKVLVRRARDLSAAEEEPHKKKHAKHHRSKRHVSKSKKHERTIHKRNLWLDDDKVQIASTELKKEIHNLVEDMTYEMFKGKKSLSDLRAALLALREKAAKQLDLPNHKAEESAADAKIAKLMQQTVPAEFETCITNLLQGLADYGNKHAPLQMMATEAEKAIMHLPVTFADVQKAKATIRKRREAVEAESRAEMANLPDILKEHFKRNTDQQEKQTSHKKRRSLHQHVKKSKKHAKKSH